MRIAHMIDDLGCGGAEQVVANLAAFQSRGGHSVQVICLRDIGANPVDTDALAEAGVEIVTLDKPPGFHFGTLRKLKTHLKRHAIEVLHTHNHLVHHYGAVAARWAGIPVILNTLHGTSSLHNSPTWAKALFWLSCLISDRVVCVDPQVHDVFRKTYLVPGKRLAVIENGIGLTRFLALPRNVPGDALTFGNIGRLDPIKGHDVLLRAFGMLRKKSRRVRLRILGEGASMLDLQELAKNLSITNDVCFEGFSLNTPLFLGNIDVYVISSLSEGLPLTLLEAMGAGLPIVATSVGGITDIVKKSGCGWLCSPGDPAALAEAMNKALAAPDLAKIGARGREAAKEFFSIERMAHDYENLYKTILA